MSSKLREAELTYEMGYDRFTELAVYFSEFNLGKFNCRSSLALRKRVSPRVIHADAACAPANNDAANIGAPMENPSDYLTVKLNRAEVTPPDDKN